MFNFCIKCHVAKAIHIMLIFINSVTFFIYKVKTLNGTKTLCMQREGWEPRTDLSINQKFAHLCSDVGPKKRWSANTIPVISTWRGVDSAVLSHAAAPGKQLPDWKQGIIWVTSQECWCMDPHSCLLTPINAQAPHCVVSLKSTDQLIVPGSNGD